ncbi:MULTISPECIES: EAL domain-containing protein [unclassified Rhodococcus (in: high G+C Gram-positive bacteria)]|uniref:EAL domain-containing protein n=1 Tax=unclassified Rhodococcus (in: high G+C Gram-positive bacteria) TaxID=192944 RepID=UPI000A932BE9|nr:MULTISPECIES: EAL domain-containing protein [unclassified Rhodococcus (in: high G+C Gram-positive bacteria)]
MEEIPAGLTVHSLYQPVVDLSTRALVGYEALARGPVGTPWESPAALFESARAHGTVGQLDWMCRVSALRGALEANLPTGLQLFVNMEPSAMNLAPPAGVAALLAEASRLSVVVEITERDLIADPASLLEAVERVRDRRWLVAVDDVGAETASLALLPFLRPDIIKLDMTFTQQRATADTARVLAAVSAESDRTGAVVLAEGIETEEHLHLAREMGAALGQGWLFGTPAPLPRREPHAGPTAADLPSDSPFAVGLTHRMPSAPTPFALAAATGGIRRGRLSLLSTIIDQFALHAAATGPSTIVLATVPHSFEVSAEQMHQAAHLAASGTLVALFGRGGAATTPPVPGLHTMRLPAADPLLRELSVIVVSPHFTAAVIGAETDGDGSTESDPVFDYRLTYDRELVLDAATLLLRRTTPVPTEPGSGPLPVFGPQRPPRMFGHGRNG